MKPVLLSLILAASAAENPAARKDDLFSSWENLPELVESLQLERLHGLTLIKLGYPQVSQGLNEREHRLYMGQTKERWQNWWSSTGEEIARARKRDAVVDLKAFDMAWEFLACGGGRPETILPVWIPKSWTLHITFSNSDYMSREKEIWTLQRTASSADLTKLRGQYAGKGWNVTLTQFEGITPEQADQTLKAMCYLYHHAPVAGATKNKETLEGLYYPHATLHLLDGQNRTVWNTEGYDFLKTRAEYGNGEAGMSYWFLKTTYASKDKWKERLTPTNEELAPYRNLLSINKPYFFSHASEIVQLFGKVGSNAELESLQQWAEKQKAATDNAMDWRTRSSDFSTELKVNVISSTQLELKATREQIQQIKTRLVKHGGKNEE